MTPFARAACTRLSVSAHAIVKRLVLGIFVAIPLRDILSLTELRTEPHRLRKLEDRIRIEDIGMFDPIGFVIAVAVCCVYGYFLVAKDPVGAIRKNMEKVKAGGAAE